MIICCGAFRVFWRGGRLHVKFRPYRYRKRLDDNLERLREDELARELARELATSKQELASVLSEMEDLCAAATSPCGAGACAGASSSSTGRS